MNKIKLSKLANINMGQSPKSENYCNNEGTPFLQGNRTFGEKYPEIDIYTKQITKLAKKGEILISVRAPVGDLNIAPVDLCIGRGLSSINSFDGNNEFLYYCLKYNVRNILKQSSGTTYDSINRDILENFELITPKKEDYIKVGEILSKIDDKIELNNKINFELEAMAKTIYDYWFLQFEFPNEEGKPYKSSGGKMVWNDELKREIPEGWEVKNLIDYCYLKNGINYNKEETVGEKYKIINVRDISSSSLFVNSNLLDEICISSNIADKYLVNKNDILIARSGSPGQVRIISIKENMIFSGFIIKCEVKESKYKEYFIYVLKKIENLISTKSNGSILKNINQESLNMLKIVIPNMEIIDNFNRKIVSIHKKIENIMEENQELTSLRDFLLPLLMNGQVGFKEE